MNKDTFGNTLEDAKRIFGRDHAHSTIALVDNIWVARFTNRPDAYAQRRGAWKPQVGFAAIDMQGKVVSNGTRKDTITLAKADIPKLEDLMRWVNHDNSCHVRHGDWEDTSCTCGLNRKLKALGLP